MKRESLYATKLLFDSIIDFYNSDYQELEHINHREQSCAFRIGHYLAQKIEIKQNQQEFTAGYCVDMEYNRQGLGGWLSKKCPLIENKHKTIRPDLIVHKRGMKDNLLVCEFKSSSPNGETQIKDFEKLNVMTSKDCKECSVNFICNYDIGLFVNIYMMFQNTECKLSPENILRSESCKMFQNGGEIIDSDTKEKLIMEILDAR